MQDIKHEVNLYNPKYLPYLTIISPLLAGLGYFHNLKAINKSKQAFFTLLGALFFTLPVIYFNKIAIDSLGNEVLYICFRFILPFVFADLISRSFSPHELKKIGISDQTYSKSFLGLFGLYILISIIYSIFILIFFFRFILDIQF